MTKKEKAVLKKFLKGTIERKARINVLYSKIKELEKLLQLAAVPSTSHISLSRNGNSDVTQEEKILLNNEEIRCKMQKVKIDIIRLEATEQRIHAALAALDTIEHTIIKCKLLEGYSWYYVTGEVNLSERMCQIRESMALEKIWPMLKTDVVNSFCIQ